MIITHTLENGFWQLGVIPPTGGSIAFGRVSIRGQWLDFMRPTPSDALGNPGLCSSFVLVPWSNRIRAGKFTFQGQPIKLQINSGDNTAIHGIGRKLPWKIQEADRTHLVLSLDSADHAPVNWPYHIRSEQRFVLNGPTLRISLSLRNLDSRPMPAGFGQHPYFQKVVGGASIALEIPFTHNIPLDKGLPTGLTSEPVPAEVDFRTLRPLGEVIADNCLTGRIPGKPVRFSYPGVAEITLDSDPIYEHLVFYAPEGKDFYAVEPVTNLNDGFNLFASGMEGTGVFILQPGEEKSGEMHFRIS